MFLIDQTCEEFLGNAEHGEHSPNWQEWQEQLENDVSDFEKSFRHSGGNQDKKLKTYPLKKVTFRNKFGVEQTEEDWFEFEYSLWWRMHSNEPRCFAGDHLTSNPYSCKF